MRLSDLKILVDEWTAQGDWDDAEIVLYDSDGNSFPEGIEMGFSCAPFMFRGRDALIISEL